MDPKSPAEVVETFGRCARALDEDGARELSIGWNTPGDSPRRFYKQAAQGRWEVRALGPAQVHEDRAVQQLTLYWPERRKTVGAVWAHLIRLPEGWRVAGAQADIRVAGLFVGGLTPPVLTAGELPGSAEAEAWGEQRLEEVHSDVIRSRDDVEAVWPIKVFGHIPPFPSVEDSAPSLRGIDAQHPALAAHARIRDALAEHKRLVFTSSVSGEGKSTLASNLAYARGLMGQTVTIVDGDLRMPRVWRRWAVDPGPGLCECVDGLDPVTASQDSSAVGVSLLTAGRAPADPSPILAKAGPIISALTTDSVIIDGAPAVDFDDAFQLAEITDAAVVVVVEVGKTRRSTLATLKQRFADRGLEPVGLVLNRTPLDEAGVLRALASEEGVQMRLLGSRWLEAIGRGAVGLHFARPGEAGRTEWIILEKSDSGLVQVGRSKICSIEAILRGATIAGPEAYGREWRAQQVTRAFATAVDQGLERMGQKAGVQADDPAAGFARMIQALVADAAAGKSLSRPDVPVTVDVSGQRLDADGKASQSLPDGVRESVVSAVQKVLGDRAAEGKDLTQADIQAHGPELAGEVIGALFGSVLPDDVEVDGRKMKVDLDLASVFSSMMGRGKEGK
ncbi:MAG: hypothetical protein KC912_18490 [Proteobacteria bacterium]|nr:hypothetical protein [Pseudomonadota bacterium]